MICKIILQFDKNQRNVQPPFKNVYNLQICQMNVMGDFL